MRALQLTLFFIANVIFITQLGRHVHLLAYGAEPSVLDRFEKGHADKERARSEKSLAALLTEYEAIDRRIAEIEKGKNVADLADARQQNSTIYEGRDALRIEIAERERKTRELRDMGLYCGYGIALYGLGLGIYRKGNDWPGFAILVTGVSILEYWASPTFFGGGGSEEYHQLLYFKILVTVVAIACVYCFWRVSECLTRR